ncbi:polysaccharide pyruvyl transferase family protein [Olivibacter sitiensis]|uniref:polysaccharide pyruvyl transferase family protein n=1 Tax=Olivibacter sitiensis TaxID=376470 RepID=UPI00041FA3D6|nr:polysaccharide pyruvyl transferase family protein [Olivibacter sitiensis]
MKEILIIGAFDRYNYGDLLFPIIIEQQLKSYGDDITFNYYGIVKSDLSALGGKPTESIQDFYQRCDDIAAGKASVIVAGGEAVAVTWNSLLVALNKYFRLTRRYQHHINRIIDLNKTAKAILKGRTDFPFVFNSNDFKAVDHVLLNSLGGSEIDPALFTKEKILKQKLQQVDYFAVRDKTTRQNLGNAGINTLLFPDSAILMSKFFPREVLAKRVSPEVRDFVADHAQNYVFFQTNRNHAKGQESLIANELNALQQQHAVKICLCPIGRALNHDDHEALESIRPLLKEDAAYFGDSHIWDVMYLIANATSYIGTSLHGAITAMSFAVPYVGLRVKKLDSYLKTWGVEALNHVVNLNEIASQYAKAIAVSKSELQRTLDIQIRESERSFDRMREIITSS